MIDPTEIDSLIEQSSFGTPGARALRQRTPDDVAADIVRRAENTVGIDAAPIAAVAPPERAAGALSMKVGTGVDLAEPLTVAVQPVAVTDAPLDRATTSTTDAEDLAVTVDAAIAGNRAAVGRLLVLIRPLVLRYCRARIGHQQYSFASADDVAQEVCLAVLTALPSYVVQGRPFLAFVYGIAAHKVADARRAAARNLSESMTDLSGEPTVEFGPEQQALHSEMSSTITELLQVLPARQRECLVLRVAVGLSAVETAEAMESTPSAVRVAVRRATSRLRSLADSWDLRSESPPG